VRKLKLFHYSALIGLVIYENGLSSYILLSHLIEMDKKIYSGSRGRKVPLLIGSALPLAYLKLFTIISAIELYPFSGSLLARAAGTGAILSAQSMETSTLKLRSVDL
jgi:ribosomal protein L2